MTDRAREVQVAVYNLIDGALTEPVYDHVPDDAPYPYVEMGPQRTSSDDTLSEQGEVHNLTLVTWSTYRGKLEVMQLHEEMFAVLHDGTLVLPAGCFTQMQVTGRRVERIAGTPQYVGEMTIRIETGDE